jgi:hypothetical protein
MKSYSIRAIVLGIGLAFVASAWSAGAALAGPFDGKIVTSSKRIPTSAKSQKAYYAELRKQSSDTFQEDREKKQWKVHFAAFFQRPLNDLEVTVKLYDITGKQRHLKVSFEQFLSGRGQQSVISHLTLDRDQFGVNRHILMTVENRGRVLASGKFKIVGKAETFSGKVEFTEEEAQGQ